MLKHSAIKDGRGQARTFDPRVSDQTDALLEALQHRAESVSRDILVQIDALPAYARQWNGTRRIVATIYARFALLPK